MGRQQVEDALTELGISANTWEGVTQQLVDLIQNNTYEPEVDAPDPNQLELPFDAPDSE